MHQFIFEEMTFKTVAELHNKYKWKSIDKFMPLAKRYGFDANDVKQYFKTHVIHDERPPPPKFMHIYSKTSGAWNFDTFINKPNYLIFININTRKAYAYPLQGKGAKTVLNALTQFIHDEPDVKSLTSDQDPAYLSKDVLTFMKEHNINYRTTEDNNHNVLGIINRFMRTIRDIADDENKDISPVEMELIIDIYNNSPHKSLNNKSPNEITKEDEQEYITKQHDNNPYDFKPNDRVRIVKAKEPLSKKRSNLTKEVYIVDSRDGNQFIVKAKDNSVDKYPGYRLVKTKNNNIAETIKNDKRGIVNNILDYNERTDKYKVQYEGGVVEQIPAKNLREGQPTQLSQLELIYWSTKSKIPDKIRKWC